MKRKTTIVAISLLAGLIFLAACGGGNSNTTPDQKIDNPQDLTNNQPEVHGPQIHEGDITVTNPLNTTMVTKGKSTYELKCQSCHKLSRRGGTDVQDHNLCIWVASLGRKHTVIYRGFIDSTDTNFILRPFAKADWQVVEFNFKFSIDHTTISLG